MSKKTIIAQANQTVYDIVIQEYGHVDDMPKLLADNPHINENDDLVPGTAIVITTDAAVIDEDVRKELASEEIAVATEGDVFEAPNLSKNVYYYRPLVTAQSIYRPGDAGDQVENYGINDYTNSIPAGASVQRLDLTDGRDKLLYYNKWGHKQRLTGTNGGFVNLIDGNTYDVNGNLSTFEVEFPIVDLGLWIVQDHLTGIEIPGRRLGARIWNDCIDEALSSTLNGNDDWLCVPMEYFILFFDFGIDNCLRSAERSPFDYDQPNAWTANTTKDDSSRAYYLRDDNTINRSGKGVSSANRSQYRFFDNSFIIQP